MYLEHFGLHTVPFGLTPDTDFFFPGSRIQSAYNTVWLALEGHAGLIKIVGEPGTGKTLLCRYLLNRLEAQRYATAYIPNPDLSPAALVHTLLHELGGSVQVGTGYGPARALALRLLEIAKAGRYTVALIDEAQAMPLKSLETLRLISNLETEKRKLLQIVLFGQPELDTKLADPSVRQILSRIAFHDRIEPLSEKEVSAYVHYRLLQAGTSRNLFKPRALAKLHRLSQGLPRYINILAHKALLLAYAEGSTEVQARHVRLAGKDTPGVHRPLWIRL